MKKLSALPLVRSRLRVAVVLCTIAALALQAACTSVGSPAQFAAAPSAPAGMPAPPPAPMLQTLSPGDVIKISFPGAPNLETTQQVRRDGHINLALVGEVQVADKTPAALEQELIRLYSSQLVSKEIKVTLVSSSFAVFVAGAVLRPGKINPEREITALQAVMEAGGFDSAKANTRAVVVIRNAGGQTVNFTLDLQSVLEGKRTEPFFLRSHDIVYVPEKFSWF